MNKFVTEKRLAHYDALKLLAIYLVILGHAIQFFVNRPPGDEPMWYFIYAFHMPLFMMISGFFSKSSMNMDFMGLIRKKTRQLLLPLFTWTLIIMAIEPLFTYQLNYNFLNSFWFLRSCFLCYIFAYLVFRFKKYRKLWICISIIIVQFIPFCKLPIMYPCFILGIVLADSKRLRQWIGEYWLVLCIVFFILLISCDWYKIGNVNFASAIRSGNWMDIVLYWTGRLYKFSIGAIGSLALIGLFTKYFTPPHHLWTKTILSWGKYTLGIYCFQTLLLGVVLRFVNCDIISPIIFNYIVAPFLSIIILAVCACVVMFIEKSRLLSFLLLGKQYFD